METKASLRGARMSAQKGRLVADLIRGKPVDQAMSILAFNPKKDVPAFGKAYSDQEIASLANYVTARFGAQASSLTADNIATLRAEN